jgi:uncharacterized phage protein gp47/JayE
MPQLTLKSQRQIQIDIVTQLIAELGLNDVNPGSVIDILSNAVAQEDFAQYVEMAKIVRLTNLDAITGNDLDDKAFEYGLSRRTAQKATGKIDILRPEGFVKVSTTFYAGLPSPIVGNIVINVNDASSPLIGTSGTLILGRGTINEEEVGYSVAPTNNLNYFTYVLDNPITKNHAIEESIILKQGNDEAITAGTLVRVSSTGTSSQINFSINNDSVLLAGEDKLSDVEVTAIIAGSDGNIPVKAISGNGAFETAPFLGARAENTTKFTTGRDLETDDELRDRIKSHIQSLSRGVKEAVINALVGLVDEETAKRIVSVNIILPQDECGPVKIYLDDGTGFEPAFESQGYEEVLRESSGGEKRLQLDIFPLVKAQIENNIEEPYNFFGGPKTLILNVGNQSETINFVASDFEFPESATAEEVVRAINDKSFLLESRTSQVGKKLTINAKSDTNEEIQVTGGTANSILGFPTDKKQTLYLYVNDQLISKDGSTAVLDTANFGPYNLQAIGAFPHTLTLIVDGKTANPQTVVFDSSDFQDPTACTIAEVVQVINDQVAGLEASSINNATKIRLVSNTKTSSKSQIEITGGSANNVTFGFNFPTLPVVGTNGDYTLNNELGTIEFKNELPAEVSVTSGSLFTRAKIRAGSSENYIPNNGETLDISVDGGPAQTITFDGSFAGGKSAEDTAAFINLQLKGATAYAREIGVVYFVEINSNTYDGGTIEVLSSSTANSAFNFELDALKTSQAPHQAFLVSGNAGPFHFRQNDSLVVVVDNDIINSAYSPILNYTGSVSSSVDPQNFGVSGFTSVFETNTSLVDFYVAFTDGANTVEGVVQSVTVLSPTTSRLTFDSLPVGLANIQANDLIKVESLTESPNNGFFIVTNISLAGNGYVDILNSTAIAEIGSAGDCIISQKRQITNYNSGTGLITVGSAFSASPSASDELIVLPSSITNLAYYINNLKITSLSLKAVIEGVDNNTRLQISSKSAGSDGYINVTGGKANDLLGFPILIYRGLQGYQYYTGLLKKAHQTIYGDDTDLVSFPGVGAAGIKFIFLAPTVTEMSVSINVTLKEKISITSLENEIKSAITGYINNLGIGDNVIIEEIRSRVQQISGVVDVVLNNPTANIVIASNELARIRESKILIG